jgi:hypothetical protein
MAVLALVLGAGTPAAGGTLGANFGVAITLSNPSAVAIPTASATATGNASGICISQSLSEATGAVVRVVCRNGHFVSISPRPGQRFLGTHGGAYNYYFGPGYGAIHRTALREGGTGTVTSFRVYSIEEADGLLDLLVSF